MDEDVKGSLLINAIGFSPSIQLLWETGYNKFNYSKDFIARPNNMNTVFLHTDYRDSFLRQKRGYGMLVIDGKLLVCEAEQFSSKYRDFSHPDLPPSKPPVFLDTTLLIFLPTQMMMMMTS